MRVAVTRLSSSWTAVRPSLRTGAYLAGITFAMEALAVLPGRVALGRAQAQLGRSPIEFAIAGTFRDISDLALPVGALIAVVLVVALLLRRSSAEAVARRRAMRILTGILVVVGVALWFTSSSAAEFKLQRGVEMTWLDVQIASRSDSFFGTFVEFIRLRRHLVPGVLALAASGAVLVLANRRAGAWTMSRRIAVVVGFVAVTLAGWGLALVPLDPHVRVFRTIADRHVVGEPFPNLFVTLGRSHENVRLGMKGLIATASFTADESRGGEALLGVPRQEATEIDCAVHPFARALPVDGVEPALPGALGHHALDPKAGRVLLLLDRLSAELFEGRAEPIDVWQLMIESFRADDLHAFVATAPRALAPYVNGLYESADRGDGSVIAVRGMWQAGARTSQGLSSYMCGMGMLAYGLSFTRDFGPLPSRCLPDVIVDAGFEPFFFYGGVPSFDGMDDFLREHRVRRIIGQQQQPLSSPTAEVGVSDRAMLAFSADLAKKEGRAPRWLLAMTGSNHVPYRRPDDLTAEIDARIQEVIDVPGFTGSADDARRLRTFAYTDLAVSELFERIGKDLSRSLVVLGADHSTMDNFLWPATPAWPMHAARGRIPWAIVLPEPLIAASARPGAVRDVARELHAAFDGTMWSQNDAPLLVLALLSHAPGMKSMPAERRWHTLGGQRSSPFFVAPKAGVRALGIDASALVLGVDDAGTTLLDRVETASYVQNAGEIHTIAPTLIPIAATLARFFNGYAERCPGVK